MERNQEDVPGRAHTEGNRLEPLLRCREVAEWLSTSESALAQLRFQHRGPAYVRLGRAIRYRREDVERFLERFRDQ